jgi:2-dehydropantoate 2-reductase
MKTQNTIYVIGAGAIGKSLSVFLKIAGRQVILLRGSVDDGNIHTEHIKVETATGSVYEADIEVATLSTFDTLNGIIVLANKSYGNAHLAEALKSKAGSSPIVLLQNGLGVEKVFMTNDFQGVYRCVLFVTSQSLDQTTIRFKPVATCPIGIEKGNADTLRTIVQELCTPHFGFKSEEHIQQIIWKKAIVNSVFNSVCPLLEIDNGIFHRNRDALEIAREIIAECIVIAGEKGVSISADEVEESLLSISRSSDGQLISTLQDILHKRKTEIDTLNFEIVRIAEALHKSDVVGNTKLLGELVKLKADTRMKMP